MKENNEMSTLLTNLTNVINDLHTCLGEMRDIMARGVDSGACSAPTERTEVGLLIEQGLKEAIEYFDQGAERDQLIVLATKGVQQCALGYHTWVGIEQCYYCGNTSRGAL